jgi:F-type H+-transporting ATPase subunit c
MSDLALIAQTIAQAAIAAEPAAEAAASSLAPVGKGLVYGLAAAGCGVGIGLVAAATLNGIARQPEQKGTLQTLMFLGIGFIEALALFGFALVFVIK